jgi:flavodoxin
MVFGHVAAGLVAKKAAPKISLGVLLVAAEALDILWGLFSAQGRRAPAALCLPVEPDVNMANGGIMRVRVVYQSTTGNTKKVAEAIARAASCAAEPASTATVSESVDILFLGASIHAGDIDPSVKKFIEGLDPALVKQVTVFNTGFEEKAVGIMKDLLVRRGVSVRDKHYFCLGKFLLFNRRHPDAQDLTRAEDFARSLVAG